MRQSVKADKVKALQDRDKAAKAREGGSHRKAPDVGMRLANCFSERSVKEFARACRGGIALAPGTIHDLLSTCVYALLLAQKDWHDERARQLDAEERLAAASDEKEAEELSREVAATKARADACADILGERRRTLGAVKRATETMLGAHKLDYEHTLGNLPKTVPIDVPDAGPGAWMPPGIKGLLMEDGSVVPVESDGA